MLGYKYRKGSEQDISALESDYFWASDFNNLNDPCEAISDKESFKVELELISKFFSGTNPVTRDALDKVYNNLDQVQNRITEAGIFSLSKICNNDLLWAHYSNSHKGFCIEYDLDVLTKNKKYDCHLIDVLYSDDPPKIDVLDLVNIKKNGFAYFLQKLIGTKAKSWSYEQEVRTITNKSGKQFYDFRAVKGIYFGLKMPDEDKQHIMNRLKGRGIKYYQLYLKHKSYNWSVNQIKDIYENSERYLYKVAPVMKDPVFEDEIKGQLKSYTPYLYKAVEVSRREPYCKKVILASFSSSESKPDTPIVFVHCEKTDGEYFNYYYSIKEIDKLYAQIDDL
jgi:hypothetical protein